MEENKPPVPVADVTPPKAQSQPHEAAVHEAPPPERTGEEAKPPAKPDKPHLKDKPRHERPPKPKDEGDGGGTGMAVAATVIIVLGLAAMATYAYLKTQ